MTNQSATIATNPKTGRKLFWAGIGIALSGVIIAGLQYSVSSLLVPWYSPIMATVGAALLLWSFTRRRTIVRLIFIVLMTLFAAAQWQFLFAASKLPEYAGPARVGEKFPPFETMLADGTPFTHQDLANGMTTVLTFFRGRW